MLQEVVAELAEVKAAAEQLRREATISRMGSRDAGVSCGPAVADATVSDVKGGRRNSVSSWPSAAQEAELLGVARLLSSMLQQVQGSCGSAVAAGEALGMMHASCGAGLAAIDSGSQKVQRECENLYFHTSVFF